MSFPRTRWQMSERKSPPPDSFTLRCAKLGHQIHFSYCRRENLGLPCARMLVCWHPYFDVETYLRLELTEEEWCEAFVRQAKPKILSLVELIEQARRKKQEKE